jgi:hypothetical protein
VNKDGVGKAATERRCGPLTRSMVTTRYLIT